jgi:hypothetical protein
MITVASTETTVGVVQQHHPSRHTLTLLLHLVVMLQHHPPL